MKLKNNRQNNKDERNTSFFFVLPKPYDLEQACSFNQSKVAAKFLLTSSEYNSICDNAWVAWAFHEASP